MLSILDVLSVIAFAFATVGVNTAEHDHQVGVDLELFQRLPLTVIGINGIVWKQDYSYSYYVKTLARRMSDTSTCGDGGFVDFVMT